MSNQLKTFIFLALLSGVLVAFGYALAGTPGIIAGFGAATLMGFFSYWFSDRIILSMHHAQEVFAGQSEGLYEIVEGLAERARLPMPKVYIIPDHSPNAFATGRDPSHGAVAVTQGLLGLLSYQELEGVLAHEMSHIKNRDTLISCIAAAMASTIMRITAFGRTRSSESADRGIGPLRLFLMALVAPAAAAIVRFAISRSGEFTADSRGADLCGHPQWLASALRKIHNMSASVPMAGGGPSTAHLYIIDPFSGSALMSLFSTHPPVEERIERLLSLQTES